MAKKSKRTKQATDQKKTIRRQTIKEILAPAEAEYKKALEQKQKEEGRRRAEAGPYHSDFWSFMIVW